MKQIILGCFLALLVACGDSTSEVYKENMSVVAEVSDLPDCTEENEGELVFVTADSAMRVCAKEKWYFAENSSPTFDYSCTTKELKNKKGIKVVCNGDSVGVVLNGSQGKTGRAGEGCTIDNWTDSTVTITCGDSTVTLEIGGSRTPDVKDTVVRDSDEVPLDSEAVAVSLDSLAGYTQKGPFTKGSTVYLYELTDGRTLKQTNGNFTSEIISDDGRYKFNSRNLVSQYALLVVDGKYRNEITGQPTNTSIQLQAYTNMLMRKSANVNLLTHLEKERVFYLVTKEKMTVRAAKRQAQAEILGAFHIDANQIKAESEDLDVFGKTDADAALLAISILLQRDSSETELSVLLTNMANDLAEDGTWDNAAKKAEIADWVATIDSNVSTSKSKLATFRSNVKGWGLGGGNVPDFEKFVRRFWSEQLGLGVCGSDSVPVGLVKHVPNKDSKKYYATSYTDAANKIRFICDDASLYRWRAATDIEKDTLGWGAGDFDGEVRKGQINSSVYYIYAMSKKAWRYATTLEKDTYKKTCSEDGTLFSGNVTDTLYVCDDGKFRFAKNRELEYNKGCTSYNKNTLIKLAESEFAEYGYMCEENGTINSYVTVKRDESKFGTLTDTRNNKTYFTIKIGNQIWMAENLNFEYKVNGASYGNYCNTEN